MVAETSNKHTRTTRSESETKRKIFFFFSVLGFRWWWWCCDDKWREREKKKTIYTITVCIQFFYSPLLLPIDIFCVHLSRCCTCVSLCLCPILDFTTQIIELYNSIEFHLFTHLMEFFFSSLRFIKCFNNLMIIMINFFFASYICVYVFSFWTNLYLTSSFFLLVFVTNVCWFLLFYLLWQSTFSQF